LYGGGRDGSIGGTWVDRLIGQGSDIMDVWRSAGSESDESACCVAALPGLRQGGWSWWRLAKISIEHNLIKGRTSAG